MRIIVCEEGFEYPKADAKCIGSPQDAYEVFKEIIGTEEHLAVIFLDNKNKLIACEIVSSGSRNQSIADPSLVFRPALARNANAVIIAHNHPSGITLPSMEDMVLTKKIIECGHVLGIPVHDHLIVSHTGFRSIREDGLCDFE